MTDHNALRSAEAPTGSALAALKERFSGLAAAMDQPGLAPWRYRSETKDREQTGRLLDKADHVVRDVILFLLSVWDPTLPAETRYHTYLIIRALKRWHPHFHLRAAFLAWAADPWWAIPLKLPASEPPEDYRERYAAMDTVPRDDWDRRFEPAVARTLHHGADLAAAMDIPFIHSLTMDIEDIGKVLEAVGQTPSADRFAFLFLFAVASPELLDYFKLPSLYLPEAMACWHPKQRQAFLDWAWDPCWTC